MKKGSSYYALENWFRLSLQAMMNYYQVDHTNKRFIGILEDTLKDLKEGKPMLTPDGQNPVKAG